jgi:hypothetical protein
VPTRLSPRDFLTFRMLAHGLVDTGLDSVDAAARRLLAVQAQDFAHAGWALGIRTATSTVSDVGSALASGTIVRSWPMRGTLHFVPAQELGWMLSLTTARMLAKTATRRRQLELDDATIQKARSTMLTALRGGRALPRKNALQALEAAGIRTDGQRGYHLLYHLGQTGTVVWGPPADNQQALVLLDEWVPAPRQLDRDEALGVFLTRYLDGHGPATLKDFAWWSGLTMADAKTARAVAATTLTQVECDGTDYLLPASIAEGGQASAPVGAAGGVHALPGFDEYIIGYGDRRPVLDPEFAPRLIPGGNGVFQPAIVSRGRAVGTWRRGADRGGREAVAFPFTSLSSRETAGFMRSTRRFRRYLEPQPPARLRGSRRAPLP